MWVVTEISEAEVRHQSVAQGVVKSSGQAVIIDKGLSSQAKVAQSRPADCVTEHRGASEFEVSVTITAKNLQLLAGSVVAAHNVLIIVKTRASTLGVVVQRSVLRTGGIRRWHLRENALRGSET